jgi:hypothetical protein
MSLPSQIEGPKFSRLRNKPLSADNEKEENELGFKSSRQRRSKHCYEMASSSMTLARLWEWRIGLPEPTNLHFPGESQISEFPLPQAIAVGPFGITPTSTT